MCYRNCHPLASTICVELRATLRYMVEGDSIFYTVSDEYYNVSQAKKK